MLWGPRGEGTEPWRRCDGEDMQVEVPRPCPESCAADISAGVPQGFLAEDTGITEVRAVGKGGAARSLILCGVWNAGDGWTSQLEEGTSD